MTTELFQEVLNDNLVIIYLDLEGKIVHANRKLFAISHFSEDEIVGKDLLSVVSLVSSDMDYKELSEGHVYKSIVTTKDDDDEDTYLALDIIPIIKGGKLVELLAIGIDITELEQKQRSKDKNIILSRSKTMEKKQQEIAMLRQALHKLEEEVHQKDDVLHEQEDELEKVKEDNKRTRAVIKKLKNVSIDLPDVLLDLEISRCRRYSTPLTLVVCGLDFFVDLEHNYSKQNLKELVEAIKKKLMTQIRDTDYISIEGHSIYIFLTNTNQGQALHFAEKTKEFFNAAKFHYKESNISLSYSILEFDPKSMKEKFLERAEEIADKMMDRTMRSQVEIYQVLEDKK
jgi:diguanylate cyclase (GGDEF)-like protein/PAS domain S-box-containing protein